MKYARKCDVTGQGMNAGFCICDGAMYIKSEKHMSEHITNDTDYASLEEAYEDDYYYYTEWEDQDDYQFDDEVEPCDECGYYDDATASHYEECSKLKS